VWNAVDSGAFNLATTVVPGDTIDFAVYGGYRAGNTPLDVTISVVPEPATLLLLGLGGLAVIRKRRA
jgi:Flp pilus assembly protein TadG